MPLLNKNLSKSKKVILTLVLILTVGFGVFGVGERAWGIETEEEMPPPPVSDLDEGETPPPPVIDLDEGETPPPPVIDLDEEEIALYSDDGRSADILVNNTFQNIATAKDAGVGNSAPPREKNTIWDILGAMIATALYYIAVGLGWILMKLIEVMLTIAVFNKFVGQPIVQQGWIIVRDICNNFFIVFMMILAGGVILGLDNYKWRAMLPKILLYAVLINFSLTLTGILIDVSQVLMLTFASPLASQVGSNIILAAIGLPEMYQMSTVVASWKGQVGVEFLDIIAALLFAIIATIVALVVIVCLSAILIWRIVMLIFLLILSPLPFLARASNISQLKSLDSEWVSKLSNMLVVGPAMMFFLYLSFLMMAASVNNTGEAVTDPNIDVSDSELPTSMDRNNLKYLTSKDSKGTVSNLSDMATREGLFKFMIVIGFLWGSLMMGQRFGDAAGKIAGTGMTKLNAGAKKFSGFNLAKSAGKAASGRAKEFSGDVTGYSALTGATNAYFTKQKEARAKARGLRVDNLEGKISGGVSAFKSGAAFIPNWIGGQVNSKLWRGIIGGNKAERLDEQVKNDKIELEESKESLKAKREELETSQDSLNTAENEAQELEKSMNLLFEYDNKRNSTDFNSDDFTMSNGLRYKKLADGSYNAINADGSLNKRGIKEEDLQDEVIGYKDEFQKLVNKARQDQANGVQDANFEKDGFRYYLRNDGQGWDKVNSITGERVAEAINDNSIRRNVTGGSLAEEINYKARERFEEVATKRNEVATKRNEIQEQQVVFHDKSVDVGLKEEQSKRLKRRQSAMDKIAKTGLVAGTTIVGGFLGGILGAGAGYAVSKGALGVAGAIKEAGKADKKIFDSVYHKQLTEAGKDLGDLDDDKIIAKIDDKSLSKFESMAFQLEAIKRGIVDANKAREIRDRILSGTSLNGQNNKKIENLIDGALFKNKQYAELSKSYKQLNSEDQAERKRGREDWGENIKDRRYKLKDLNKEATEKLIDVFVEKLDGSSFNAQFDEAKKDGKADQVIDALKKFIADNPNNPNKNQAQENLAKIIGVREAYGSDNNGALEFIKKMSTRDLRDLFEKDEKKFNQIVELAEGRMDRFSNGVQSYLVNNNGRAMKSALNIS